MTNFLTKPLPGSARIEAAIARDPKKTLLLGFIAGSVWVGLVGVVTVLTAR